MKGPTNSKQNGVKPNGTALITENGIHNVSDYATADVNVDLLDLYLMAQLPFYRNDNITSLRGSAFRNSPITTLELPNCTGFGGGQCFVYASTLNYYLPKLRGTSSECFLGAAVKKIAFKSVERLEGYAFSSSAIRDIILEKNQVVTAYSSTFNGTAFKNSTTGRIFVPYAQVANYNANSVWSSLASTGYTMIKSIQENLVELQELDVYKFELSDYYSIVTELPASGIYDTKVYFIETATPGTYEQWFHGSGSWEQLQNITLESEETI